MFYFQSLQILVKFEYTSSYTSCNYRENIFYKCISRLLASLELQLSNKPSNTNCFKKKLSVSFLYIYFTFIGVCKASTDELASTAEVVDLLLALTTEAATHARANKILNPFPLVIDPTTKMKILNPNKPDYNLCSTIAEALPSMQQLVSSEDAGNYKKKQKN